MTPELRVCWLGAQSADLEAVGLSVRYCADYNALAASMRAELPDAVVVDVHVLAMPAAGVVAALRRMPGAKVLPIMFLSAPGHEVQAVQALGAGADDHVVKPFRAELLAARIQAAVEGARRRAPEPQWSRHILRTRDGQLILDLKAFRCRVRSGLLYEDRRLTRRQFEVLALLLKRANQAVRWQDFIAKGWSPSKLRRQSRTLVQHVMRLRQTLGPVAERLETIPSIGYRWND